MHNLLPELEFRTSRSGGKGGQHVNKVETQVEVRWNIQRSQLLSAEEKELLIQRKKKKINKHHELIVVCNETRTQFSNKEIAIQKLHLFVEHALQKRKARIATKVSKSAVRKRIAAKKQHGEIKSTRQKVQRWNLSEKE